MNAATTNGHISAFPLAWPAARPRSRNRQRSRFKVGSFARVRDELLNELKLMGARQVVLSTNLRLRQDGLPLANQAQPADPAVAVYFTYKGKPVCFACDRWHRIDDNLQAIRHTIEALRGIARWGTGDMVDAAFTGFAALPAANVGTQAWWEVLAVCRTAAWPAIEAAYRSKAREAHPDRGGSESQMQQLNRALDDAKREKQ